MTEAEILREVARVQRALEELEAGLWTEFKGDALIRAMRKETYAIVALMPAVADLEPEPRGRVMEAVRGARAAWDSLKAKVAQSTAG